MTYPPQQPGPYGQQDPWGQQQPQYPSQTPPWLANGPGGFPSFEPEPKKSKAGLITTLIIVGILVLGGGGFGLWMLLKDDDKNGGGGGGGDDGGGGADARTVAEQYVEELEKAVNTDIQDIELAPLEPVTCADDFDRMEREIGDAQSAAEEGSETPEPPGQIEVGMEDFQSTEDEGSFTLTQTVEGEEGPDTEMTMAKEDGAWTVCGLYGGEGGDDGPPSEAPDPENTDEPSGGQVPNPIPTT